jgi:hypothetical protein
MWLLWEQLFAFGLLVATFIYVRSSSAVLRSLLPRTFTAEMGLALTALFYVTPSTLIGLGLYLAHVKAGVIWISVTAVYLSWGQDMLYVAGMTYYYLVLRRIRNHPASFALLIRLQEYAVWPSSDVVRKPFDYLLPRIPFARRWKKTTVLIKPIDFHRFLKNDLRLVDEAEPDQLSLTYAEYCAVPHFLLPPESLREARPPGFAQAGEKKSDSEQPGLEASEHEPGLASLLGVSDKLASIKCLIEEGPTETVTERRLQRLRSIQEKNRPETNATRYYLVNRSLHAELSEELWNTSRGLCQTLPSVIARTWKTFHFQESMRLRFVALFNTADLIQRLVGSIALCSLRDAGLLADNKVGEEEFRVPASTLQWTRALELALAAHGNLLARLSTILLEPSEDYREWQTRLAPFGAVLGRTIEFSSNNRNRLAGWRVLGTLRNKIIGHGGIGTHLRLRPLLYVSSVHHFFLSMMRNIVDLNLGLVASADHDLKDFTLDQGLGVPRKLAGAHFAFASLDDQSLVALHPYFRYHEGRLLIINRVTKERASYIDYNVANIFEPSFVTLKTDWDEFITPL